MTRRSRWLLLGGLVAFAVVARGPCSREIARDVSERGEVRATCTILMQIQAALELARNPDGLGEYPPTNAAALRIGRRQIGVGNDINTGIETVAIVLFLRDLDTGEPLDRDLLINTDEDRATGHFTRHESPDLFEIRDAWGHPLVYIHHRDYEASRIHGVRLRLANGLTVIARPVQNAVTGTFQNLESYQLFSIGPDGIPNTEDDIRNF